MFNDIPPTVHLTYSNYATMQEKVTFNKAVTLSAKDLLASKETTELCSHTDSSLKGAGDP